MSDELTICAKCKHYMEGADSFPTYIGSFFTMVPAFPDLCKTHLPIDPVSGKKLWQLPKNKNHGHCPDYEYGAPILRKVVEHGPRKHWWQK